MKTPVACLVFLFASVFATAQPARTNIDALNVVSTANGLAVQLTWKKGAENVAYFIVERSTNGVDFTRCAIVFTSEDPDFVDYKYRDKIGSTSQGLVYRLALVDEQRRISYLPAKTLIAPGNP